jgi:cyclopropane-fatty-acyl-phospholipid synthase
MIETSARPAASATAAATLGFLRNLLRDYPRDFAVRLWDGSVWEPDAGVEARATIVLRHPGALRAMLWPPGELTLAEAFLYDDFDVEGDLGALFPLVDRLLDRELSLAERLRTMRRLLMLPSERRPREGRRRAQLRGRRSSLERDRQAISYHYDVSNEFFALWLDSTMAYSCAVFAVPDEDLETAQRRKLDYVCRKLRLKPGEHLLDIGCGWGGLVMHAAREYGVNALGVTLSQNQAELAQERIRAAGLGDRCRVEMGDYREVDERERFDKLVSVGMYEHVAREALGDYFAHARRLLRPRGVFLAHGIARSATASDGSGPSFLNAYVFPDNDLVPIATVLAAAESAELEVRDVESLREHYALTTRRWLERLEAQCDEARRVTNDVIYRTWRLMCAASAYRFARAELSVYQTLLVKPDDGASGLPLSRADWYASQAAASA